MGTSARPCTEEEEDDGGDDDGAGASDGGAVRAPLPDARFWRYEEAGAGPSKAKFSGVFEVEWTSQMLLAYLKRMARSPMSTDRDDAAPGVVAGPVPCHLNCLWSPQLGAFIFSCA